MTNDLSCSECSYSWKDTENDIPFCHWRPLCADDIAPCEEVFAEEDEDFYEDEEECEPEDLPIDAYEPDLEMGFDPYMGCYTDDC